MNTLTKISNGDANDVVLHVIYLELQIVSDITQKVLLNDKGIRWALLHIHFKALANETQIFSQFIFINNNNYNMLKSIKELSRVLSRLGSSYFDQIYILCFI